MASGRLQEGSVFWDAGLPSREVRRQDLDLPMEPLLDILLPFFGLSISALGLQVTLGLSLVEPVMLLALPAFRSALHFFDHRMLSWHLGGLFGHPMIVAQVVIARAERGKPGCGSAAFGALIGAYAAGAFAGALVLRNPLFPSTTAAAKETSLLAPDQVVRAVFVVALVASNLAAVPWISSLLAESSRPSSPHTPLGVLGDALAQQHEANETTPLQGGRECTRECGAPCWALQWLMQRFGSGLLQVAREVGRTFEVAFRCAPELAARSLVVFSLSLIMGAWPPLGSVTPAKVLVGLEMWRGAGVLWFDIIGVLASGVAVPVVLSPGLSALEGDACLSCMLRLGCLSCGLLALASARPLWDTPDFAFGVAVAAGAVLSVAAVFAHVVLSTRMLERISDEDAGIALGWGLLAGGAAELLGAGGGQALLYDSKFLWPSLLALLACIAAQGASRKRPAWGGLGAARQALA